MTAAARRPSLRLSGNSRAAPRTPTDPGARRTSDADREFVRPPLPESLRGRKRRDDRRVLNGTVWKFRTGTAWRDVPDRYGPWATLHARFRRWAADGTCDRMLRAAQAKADAAGDVEWLMSVDSGAHCPFREYPGGPPDARAASSLAGHNFASRQGSGSTGRPTGPLSPAAPRTLDPAQTPATATCTARIDSAQVNLRSLERHSQRGPDTLADRSALTRTD
ncbi:transposase [Streptomyces sp. DASNCL29]|nr:transposase [Streptomyces sp. DASNCL29]